MTDDLRERMSMWFAMHFPSGTIKAGRYAGERFDLLHELSLPGWWAVQIGDDIRDVRERDIQG